MTIGILGLAVDKRPAAEKWIMIGEAAFFALLFFWLSCNLTVELCPDERTRLQIPFWILENGSLPTGVEPLLRIKGYGFSYATSVYGPSILASLFMGIASLVTKETVVLVIAARLPSVLSGIGIVLACNGIGRRLFRSSSAGNLLALLVCGLPQVVFLCSYHNNDAPSLFAAALIVYSWLFGRDDEWTQRSCCLLGLAIGICALTYYFAFGFILLSVVYFFASQMGRVRAGKSSALEMLLGAAVVTTVALLAGGWFYIRLALELDGDFFGRATTSTMRNTFGISRFRDGSGTTMAEQGVSLVDMLFVRQGNRSSSWVVSTLRSFVGVFGNGSFPISDVAFVGYFGLSLFGLLGIAPTFSDRSVRRIVAAAAASSLIAICLSVFYSYTSDYQAQGRYIIVCVLPLGVLAVAGLRFSDRFIGLRFKTLIGPKNHVDADGQVTMPVSLLVAVVYLILLALAINGPMASNNFIGVLNGYKFWWPYWY